jgi:acetyl-CoA acetyltransferase
MPITVEDVLNPRMIAYPFRLLQCCLVTDGGGALSWSPPSASAASRKKPVTCLAPGADIMDACEMAWNRFANNHRLVRSLCAVAWGSASPPLCFDAYTKSPARSLDPNPSLTQASACAR